MTTSCKELDCICFKCANKCDLCKGRIITPYCTGWLKCLTGKYK